VTLVCGCSGVSWKEAKDTVIHGTMHGVFSQPQEGMIKIYQVESVSSAEL
jgi:hypothetical protein